MKLGDQWDELRDGWSEARIRVTLEEPERADRAATARGSPSASARHARLGTAPPRKWLLDASLAATKMGSAAKSVSCARFPPQGRCRRRARYGSWRAIRYDDRERQPQARRGRE